MYHTFRLLGNARANGLVVKYSFAMNVEISCAGGSIPPWRNRFVYMNFYTFKYGTRLPRFALLLGLCYLCANLLCLLLTFF